MKDILTRMALENLRIGSSHLGSSLHETRRPQVAHGNVVWTVAGANLSVAAVNPFRYLLPYVGVRAVIENIRATLGTAPGAADLHVTINIKHGANPWASLIVAGFLNIPVGSTSASLDTGFLNSGVIYMNDSFQMEIVQGDATAADMLLQMCYRWILMVG